MHEAFLGLVNKMLDSESEYDIGQYEDDVRSLLGQYSYQLFTMDKLVYKLVKQLQQVLTEENGTKLIQLFKYERSRTDARVPFSDALYYQNAHVFLPDEHLFRLEAKVRPEGGCKVTAQLFEPDRSDVPAGVMEPGFAGFLSSFLDTPSVAIKQVPGTPKFVLGRNLKRKLGAEGPDSLLDGSLLSARVFNALECKISSQSSKVSYVLDTEDVLYRPRKKVQPNPARNAIRSIKFREYVETQRNVGFTAPAAPAPEAAMMAVAMAAGGALASTGAPAAAAPAPGAAEAAVVPVAEAAAPAPEPMDTTA